MLDIVSLSSNNLPDVDLPTSVALHDIDSMFQLNFFVTRRKPSSPLIRLPSLPSLTRIITFNSHSGIRCGGSWILIVASVLRLQYNQTARCRISVICRFVNSHS